MIMNNTGRPRDILLDETCIVRKEPILVVGISQSVHARRRILEVFKVDSRVLGVPLLDMGAEFDRYQGLRPLIFSVIFLLGIIVLLGVIVYHWEHLVLVISWSFIVLGDRIDPEGAEPRRRRPRLL